MKKSYFYLKSLFLDWLSVSDAIVYSQILHRSLSECGAGVFATDGSFSEERLRDSFGGGVEISGYARRLSADDVSLSRMQFYLSMRKLRSLGYIYDNGSGEMVAIPDGVLRPYFPLRVDTGLSGLSLVVFSFICFKCVKFGWIDNYHSSMAKELGLSESTLSRCLKRLVDGGHLEKMRRGKQVLLRVSR